MSTTAASVIDSLTAQESAGAVKNKANFIQARTRNSPDAEAHRMSAAALSNLQDQINALIRQVRLLAGVTGSGGTTPATTSSAIFYYHTISGAFTINASVMPPTPNTLLIVALTFSSAVQPVFAASDFSLPPGPLAIAVGTHSNIIFGPDAAGTKWMMIAPPVTGR